MAAALAGPLGRTPRPPRPWAPSSRRQVRSPRSPAASCCPIGRLLRRPPVAVDGVDVGRHDEQVGLELLGEQRARAVLVDDDLGADQRLACPARTSSGCRRRRCRSTTAPFSSSQRDRPDLEDPLRQRRRDDAPPLVAVRLDRPALLGGQALGVAPLVDRADELGRVAERRVVRVDLDHRQDASRTGCSNGRRLPSSCSIM